MNIICLIFGHRRVVKDWYPNDKFTKVVCRRCNKLIKEYPNPAYEEQENIAVISYSIEYFQNWKKIIKPNSDFFDKIKKFTIKNKTYHCITKVSDTHGLRFNDIMFTDKANENSQFYDILDSENIKNLL